jgi:hypothetical protein
VTACFIASLLIHVAGVTRPRGWLARWRTVLASGCSLIGLGVLLGAGALVVRTAASPLDAPTTALVDRAIRYSLIWAMIVAAAQIFRQVARSRRRAPTG